jgi:hypothetical protein
MIKMLTKIIFSIMLSEVFFYGQDDIYVYEREMQKANKTPRIEINYEIILSTSMEKTLKKYAPDFKPWTAKHFHPVVFTDAEYGYRFRDRKDMVTYRIMQSPSIVIGDFNGDGREDLVMDGYNKTHEVRIFLLSENNSYSVIISTISKLPNDFNPLKPEMSPKVISLVEKGKVIKSKYEELPLKLKTDAIKETGETWEYIWYYNPLEKKFSKYIIGD